MKICEFFDKPDELLVEYENFSNISSMTMNDPMIDEFGMQDRSRKRGQSRKPLISLRHIHKLKLIHAAKRIEHEKRKKLMGLMYAVPTEEAGMEGP